jgi:methylaspartate mutase epsilon subunit
MIRTTGLDRFVEAQRGKLVIQPRMGFSDLARMRRGLLAVKALPFPTVGTITLDSFTRVGDLQQAAAAVQESKPLNGFPILSYAPEQVRELLAEVADNGFPVQVRHGTPLPLNLFRGLRRIGLVATEGGPISYCLPYGQVPLTQCIDNWADSCQLLAESEGDGSHPHLESFGGCMMGQLSPPALLIAITILEGMFFTQHGLRSLSLSYAQGTNPCQDAGAVVALRRLAARYLTQRWHLVLYMYMGLFPKTVLGAHKLIDGAASLAAQTGCERIIIKTAVESQHIPSIEDNLSAMRRTAAAAGQQRSLDAQQVGVHAAELEEEAATLIDSVLNLGTDLKRSLRLAFARGLLDVPYCLHPDNRGATRTQIDDHGIIHWLDTGRLALRSRPQLTVFGPRLSSDGLLDSLSYHRRALDEQPALVDAPPHVNLNAQNGAPGRAVLATIPSDSHSWNLIFIEQLLREHGYAVLPLGTCTAISRTVQSCLDHPPDLLVISTVNGHGYLEGAELARCIRREPTLAGTRLVIGGLLGSDPLQLHDQVAELRRAGFDHVYAGDTAVRQFRHFLSTPGLTCEFPCADSPRAPEEKRGMI